ncbi:MAG: hypothetical protein SGJ24_05275 [Chloroflexota bacterium]|nr:hypothetical protein [Chloroflexota bacterium]
MKQGFLARLSAVIVALASAVLIVPVSAQTPTGYSVTCDDGTTFDNGVEVIVNQMRSGFTYTATAIGLNGFDPVLAVLDATTGSGLCSDDATSASRYDANLPTTGGVGASGLSAQVNFSQDSAQSFADISLVVGGYGNQTGEFLLILEGMAVTSADNAGDAFSVNVTPGMVSSGIPLTTYMLTRGSSGVDPLVYQSLPGSSDYATDSAGNPVFCDDSGDPNTCYDTGVRLDDYNVTIASGTLSGWQYDAMLTTALDDLALSADRSTNYLTYYMTSYQGTSEGQYLLVFHAAISDTITEAASDAFGGGLSSGQEQQRGDPIAPTQVPSNAGAFVPGYAVTCDDGSSFDNGVEVIVNQMRSGFTYTATAVGLNGFDPVLAVLNTQTGEGLCSDDATGALRYAANLPTTGGVGTSGLSAQVNFSQNSAEAFADISLVVGGYGNQTGEFLLILEGMAVTSADNAGDAFSVNITPGMASSGVPLTTYMLTRGTSGVDPLVYQSVPGSSDYATDNNGDPIYCDDSGNAANCYDTGVTLTNYNVTIATGTLPGWQYDAMLTTPLNGLALDSERTNNYFTYYMTSYQGTSEGQYLLVFHMGISDVFVPNA